MNIFILDSDPTLAAQAQHDMHVVKMTLETAQILSTVLHAIGQGADLYRPTHARHPCTLWASATRANAEWLIVHGIALGEEYRHRFGRTHKSASMIDRASCRLEALPTGALTAFAQVMPEAYRDVDAVMAYRRYYCTEKMHMRGTSVRWTSREPPAWTAAVGHTA